MASDSATLVPTQQSVKAYVDSQIGGLSSSLSGLSDTNITTPADGALLFYDTGTSTWIDNVVSGDITIADTGVAAISSAVIVNDDINASAAISVSKTALVDGTGLTLTGDTLSVDASQTQITAVGTIATGTWQGTAIADAYVADNLTISGGTVDNSVIGGTTAAAGTFTDLTASGTLTLGGTAVTSTATEINLLDGVTATTAEINYVDGVTSNIQTQLDSKVGANYTGDVDITGELLVDSYNETFKKVSSVGTAVGYRLGSASYDSVRFSIASQETSPGRIRVNNDGTKMYDVGYNGDEINQYSLSTAYDLSTASFDSVTFSVASQSTFPMDMVFNNDGTKFFVLEYTGAIYQYSCSTAYDMSTASYDSLSANISGQSTQNLGFIINNDGTKIFTVEAVNDVIRQYSLSTAFTINTLSYDSVSFSVSGQETSPRAIASNSDGTIVYIAGTSNDTVYEYTLTTGFDLSTASYSGTSFSVNSQDATPEGIVFNSDGTKMYMVGNTNDTVYQYSTSATTYSTTFDCENANVFETELDVNTTVVFSNPPASGTPVVTYYDIGNASYDSVDFSVATQETAPVAVEFSSDGTAMYVSGGVNPENVFQYTLSTAWDLSTASYASKSFNYSSQETTGTGLAFKTDGTVMYVVGSANDTVYQYTLSTAWDVSTASYASKSFSVSTQALVPSALSFSPDGTKMYVVHEGTGEAIFQYTLSTAWDVSTASYASKTLSVASEELGPSGMSFNSDGTQLFMCGRTNDKVYKYTLSTAYDISTGSYDSVTLDISTEDASVNGMAFKSDGSKLYIVGYSNDKVYQYSTTSSSLNDSTAYAMSLKVVQDSGASGYTVTWPTSVDWPAATAPTLTATASAVDQFVFYTYDGGTNWYGFTAGQALG